MANRLPEDGPRLETTDPLALHNRIIRRCLPEARRLFAESIRDWPHNDVIVEILLLDFDKVTSLDVAMLLADDEKEGKITSLVRVQPRAEAADALRPYCPEAAESLEAGPMPGRPLTILMTTKQRPYVEHSHADERADG